MRIFALIEFPSWSVSCKYYYQRSINQFWFLLGVGEWVCKWQMMKTKELKWSIENGALQFNRRRNWISKNEMMVQRNWTKHSSQYSFFAYTTWGVCLCFIAFHARNWNRFTWLGLEIRNEIEQNEAVHVFVSRNSTMNLDREA